MKNRDSKRRTNRNVLILYSISGLMALLSLFFPSARAQSLDGFWQSDAYGLLVEIRGANLNTSQTTSISCLPWWTAKRADGDGKKSEVVFERGDTPIRLTSGSA